MYRIVDVETRRLWATCNTIETAQYLRREADDCTGRRHVIERREEDVL